MALDFRVLRSRHEYTWLFICGNGWSIFCCRPASIWQSGLCRGSSGSKMIDQHYKDHQKNVY